MGLILATCGQDDQWTSSLTGRRLFDHPCATLDAPYTTDPIRCQAKWQGVRYAGHGGAAARPRTLICGSEYLGRGLENALREMDVALASTF